MIGVEFRPVPVGNSRTPGTRTVLTLDGRVLSDQEREVASEAVRKLWLGQRAQAEAGRIIRGWAQWVDDDNYYFEVTDSPSCAQEPAILTLLPDTFDEAARSARGEGING